MYQIMKIRLLTLTVIAATTLFAACEDYGDITPDHNPNASTTGMGNGTNNGTGQNPVPGNNDTGDNGTDNNNGTGNTYPGGSQQQGPSSVIASVKDFIAGKYPGARIVEIDVERNSIEVDIIDGYVSRDVVFSQAGQWIYTETDLRRGDLPQAVLGTLAAQYGGWYIDDVNLIETPSGSHYLLELESGHRETRLKIDASGRIL